MRFLSFVTFIFFASFRLTAEPLVVFKTDMESLPGKGWINTSTFLNGNASSGTTFSRADSASPYGIGLEEKFLDQLQGKNLRILVSGMFRIEKSSPGSQLVLMLSKKDSTIYWNSSDLSGEINGADWQFLKREFILPKNFTDSLTYFKIFIWNSNRIGAIDCDDLEISFYECTIPSFLPDVVPDFKRNSTTSINIIDHPSLRTVYDYDGKSICIANKFGDTLISSFTIYAEIEKADGLKNSEQKSTFTFIESSNDKAVFETPFSCGTFRLTFIKNDTLPNLHVTGTMNFSKSCTVFRWAIVGSFSEPFSEVVSYSRQRIDAPYGEFWIGKEPFLNGKGQQRLLVCNSDLSSVQLSTDRKQAIFNLDYALDHPMLHFPLMSKSEGVFKDVSSSQYSKGSVLNGSFDLFLTALKELPIVASYPDGYKSAMIFTEHADYSDIRTHRALYFGSDSILEFKDACGGFAGHGIPVTKSVFYHNPTHEMTSVKHGAFQSESANIKGTEGFKDFLDQLAAHGYEICLHSPDPYTTNRSALENALDFFQNVYRSSTWIDHGYDNSPVSNREDLNGDGFIKGKKAYAADLWSRYGIHYFWNSFYEDSAPWKPFSFNSFFSVPYHGFGEMFPFPVYWRHKQRTGESIHWRTTGTMDPPDNSMWEYYFNDQRLSDLAISGRAEFLHMYAPRVDSTNGYYTMSEDKIKIDSRFDALLKKLSFLRASKKIWLTTVKEFLDYQLNLEKVTISVTAEGILSFKNNSPANLKQFTLLLPEEMNTVRLNDNSMVNISGKTWILPEFKSGEEIEILPFMR